jgi:hypothetical protein
VLYEEFGCICHRPKRGRFPQGKAVSLVDRAAALAR